MRRCGRMCYLCPGGKARFASGLETRRTQLKSLPAISRAYKILIFTAVVLFVLPSLLYLLLMSAGAQTYLARKAVAFAREQYGLEMSIGRVDIRLFSTIELEQVFVADEQGDTLVSLTELWLDFDEFSMKRKRVVFDEIVLLEPRGSLRADSTGRMNFQYLIDAFASDKPPKPDDTTASPWDLSFYRFRVEDARFDYQVEGAEPDSGYLDFNNLGITDFDLVIDDFSSQGDTLLFELEHLGFRDHSGFVFRDLRADCLYSGQHLELDRLGLLFEGSSLHAQRLALHYPSTEAFDEFERLVRLELRLDSSNLRTQDLAHFVPELRGLEDSVALAGKVEGTVEHLVGEGFSLRHGRETALSTDFRLDGLPDMAKARLDFHRLDLRTSAADLAAVRLPPFDSLVFLELPDEVARMGRIHYTGRVAMLEGDILPRGKLQTDAGELDFDMVLRTDTATGDMSFEGGTQIIRLDLGRILDSESLGWLSLEAKLKGGSSPTQAFFADIERLEVLSLEVNGYPYQHIKAQGKASDEGFRGTIDIEDPNLRMRNKVLIDMGQDLTYVEYESQLFFADLYALGLDTVRPNPMLSLEMSGHLLGSDIENLEGFMDMPMIRYWDDEHDIETAVDMVVTRDAEQVRLVEIDLRDIFHATIEGQFKIESITQQLSDFFFGLMPVMAAASAPAEDEPVPPAEPAPDEYFDFMINFKDIASLTEVFMPELSIDNKTKINGRFSTRDKFSMSLVSSFVQLSSNRLEDFFVEAQTREGRLLMDIGMKRFFLSDSMALENVLIFNEIHNDSVESRVRWNDWKPKNTRGSLDLVSFFSLRDSLAAPTLNVSFLPSEITLLDSIWAIERCHLTIDSSRVAIDDLTIFNESSILSSDLEQNIKVSGVVSESPHDSLIVVVNNLNLAFVNVFMEGTEFSLEGILNTRANLSGLYESPVVLSHNVISNFTVNGQNFGDMTLATDWDPRSKRAHTHLYAVRRDTTINIEGYLEPETGALNFQKVIFDKFPLAIFNPFLEGAITINDQSIRMSRMNADLRLTGTLEKPSLNGRVYLKSFNFVVDMLQSNYQFSDTIHIVNNDILFNDMKIYTPPNGVGRLNGGIYTGDFSDIRIDLLFKAANFLFLDTPPTEEALYYGKVFADMDCSIKGKPDDLAVKLWAKTNKDTQINISLGQASEANQADYITFVTTDTSALRQDEPEPITGINLNFDLEIDPQTEVRIIFDPQTGEMLKIQGAANLRMAMNALGDISMNGDYVVEKGNYMLNLENVIMREFNVSRGGSLVWTNDPANAKVDLAAVYEIKNVLLYDLTQDERDLETKVTVNCMLVISDYLADPKLEFRVSLPDAQERINSQLAGLSPEEMNKQFLTLLIVRRFQPLPGMQGGVQTGGGFGSDQLLSNQLSNWLSQISNDFDIGVDYNSGSEITGEQLEVAMQTQFLDDKLKVNVGVTGQSQSQSAAAASGGNIAGDFELEYKISQKFQVKAYNKSTDPSRADLGAAYIQGLGIFYRKDFTYLRELKLFRWLGKPNEPRVIEEMP